MCPVKGEPRSCRLLILEDDEDDVFLFKRALERAKEKLHVAIDVERVENGLEGVLLVSTEDLLGKLPDAMVLDLNMPRLDGVKFLRALRQSLRLTNLPVFVLTATPSAPIHDEAIRAGASRVFVKPNDADALVAIATEIIQASCTAAAHG